MTTPPTKSNMSLTSDMSEGERYTTPSHLLEVGPSILIDTSEQMVTMVSQIYIDTLLNGSILTTWNSDPGTFSEGNATSYHTSDATLRRTDWSWQLITWSGLVVFQVISAVVGIVGNFLVILVLFDRRTLRNSADTLIGNLAVADFLTSVFLIPIPRASRVPATLLAELYCRLIFTYFFMRVCVTASVYTLTAISVERFLAIVYPIQFKRLKRRKHVIIVILLIWTASVIASLFPPLTVAVHDASNSCKVQYESKENQVVSGIASLFIDFVFPALVMLSTQVIAVRKLHLESKRFKNTILLSNSRSNASLNLLVAKNRLLQMLFMVIMIFIVCWGPNEIALFLYNLHVLDSTYRYGSVHLALAVLGYYNSCANPVIYTLRYPLFRNAIKGLLTCSKRNRGIIFDFQTNPSKGSKSPSNKQSQTNDRSSQTSRV